MISPSASWSYQPSPYYYKIISVNSVHRFSVSLGKWSGCVTCRCLYGRFQNRHRPISQSFIKAKLEEGNADLEPCFCWLALVLILQPYIWFLQTDVFWKWISCLASCWITSFRWNLGGSNNDGASGFPFSFYSEQLNSTQTGQKEMLRDSSDVTVPTQR